MIRRKKTRRNRRGDGCEEKEELRKGEEKDVEQIK
jgi:hypothetical protein